MAATFDPDESELDALMARLSCGDRDAFEPLYCALAPRARRLACAKLGADVAADVAQAALLDVFARASEFTPGRACLPWFYGVVANEIQRVRRKGARLVLGHAAAEDAERGDEGDAARALVDRDLRRALDRAIAELDEDAMAAVGAMLNDTTIPAIAPATFRKRLSRAYAKLRVLLGSHDAI